MEYINLLYVITKLELGGAQKQLLSLIKNLDKTKYKIFLFTAKEGILLKEASSIKEITLVTSANLERSINPFRDILALIEIYHFIKENKIEIVHTHSSKAGILGRWAAKLAKVNPVRNTKALREKSKISNGVKIILHTVHGWSFNDYQPRLKRKFFVWIERLSAKFTDRLIVVSHYDKERGLENRIGKEEKYQLIRYGIDYTEFNIKDQNIRKELGINNTDLVVSMISCLKPQKSPQDFIRLAFLINQILPDVKFLLVGNGILRKRTQELIDRFNLQKCVILTGWRRDIYRILSATDVFVLTSLWEGLPIAVLEAMAASIPMVVTHAGGIAEAVIDGKTGFLIPPRSPKLMSERLALLLKDENLRRHMGENARNNLGFDFALGNMVKNTRGLYDSLFEKKERSKYG